MRSIRIDTQSKHFFLVTLAICGSLLALLASLTVLFVVKRRAYLTRRLVGELSASSLEKGDGGGGYSDKEQLVKEEEANKGKRLPWSSWFVRKSAANTSPSDSSTHQDYQVTDGQKSNLMI